MHNELKIFGCNYRHYNLHDERWIGKDKISENLIANNYVFINNEPKSDINILGLYSWGDFGIDPLSAALVVGDAAKKVAVKDTKGKVKKQLNVLRFMMDTKLPIKMQRNVKLASNALII